MDGHQAVDAARNVQAMTIARVAAHASAAEAEEWAGRQVRDDVAEPEREDDKRAAWRASLEALGIKVEI